MKNNNNYLTHGIHPYHAKYIPEIPHDYIIKYSSKGELVFDPFCGSGTTLLEAMLAERKSIGTDLSLIAYKISKAKTTFIDVDKLELFYKKIMDNLNTQINFEPIKFENKNMWFSENTLETLDKVFFLISEIEDIKYRNIFEVIFSSILKTVSNKRKTWNNGYIADNVLPDIEYNGNALQVFKNKVKKTIKDFKKLNEFLSSKTIYEPDVFCSNILNFDYDSTVDLVITSPPYPFAVDFIKYNRLSCYWFGVDVNLQANAETGSRHKRSRKNAVVEFFIEMEEIYKNIFKMVKTNGHFCMTVSDTHRNNKKISFVEWLINLFIENGWILVENTIRQVENQSMPQKRISQEHMLVFKKVK